MKYIDIHDHLNFNAYNEDREAVIKRTQEAGVATISVGTNLETSEKALEIAKEHSDSYATVGLHPIHTSASHHDIQELGEGGKEFTSKGEVVNKGAYLELAKESKVVAIGESGLDFYHLEPGMKEKQHQAFQVMIDIANKVKKPLMLHVRNGKEAGLFAYKEAYSTLKEQSKVLANLHFFAGSIEEAKPFLDLGYSFSFTGAITFGTNYQEIIRYLPLDRIMSETDCPYVTPIPYRGERNEPIRVIEVVKAIAAIRGQDLEIVANQLLENARSFFKIKI